MDEYTNQHMTTWCTYLALSVNVHFVIGANMLSRLSALTITCNIYDCLPVFQILV